jgi:hypothetical protein
VTLEKVDKRNKVKSDLPAAPRMESGGASTISEEIGAVDGSTSGPTRFSGNDRTANDPAERGKASLPLNLRGTKWLDQLIFDGSRVLAPPSLRQDVKTVLKWLNVEEPGAIKTKHYDKFGRAIQGHIMQGRESPAERAPQKATSLNLTLNDEIRAVFDRLLDREQAALIFDQALMWFAKIWITVVVTLNVIFIVGLVLSATTLWTGIVKLSEIYSLWNIWSWIAEAVALSPALGALAWQARRLKQPLLSSIGLRMIDLLTRGRRPPAVR